MSGQVDRTFFKRRMATLLAPVAALALAGCVGTSTYGTGKTQEEQLYEDLLSIAAIGGTAEKKEPINYMSRPGLVKPPQSAQLPAPAQSVSSQAGYYPQDPELRRAKLLQDIQEAEANGGELPPEVAAARAESAARTRGRSGGANEVSDKITLKEDHNPELARRQREVFLAEQARRRGAVGAAPRKYLTEPPAAYRTPKQSAEIGSVGEKEKDPYARGKEKGILEQIFSRD